MDALPTYSEWSGYDGDARLVVLDALLARLPSGFVPVQHAVRDRPLPVLEHTATGLSFVAVFGGTFVMGMSPGRLRRAARLVNRELIDTESLTPLRELEARFAAHTPARQVRVEPFLLAAGLASNALWRRLGVGGEGLLGTTLSGWAVHEASEALSRLELRLPSEAELEYASRLGVDTLSPSLDDDGPDAPWGPGLIDGIGHTDELCADAWHPSFIDAPETSEPWGAGAQVIRSTARRPWSWPRAWAVCVCPRRAERGVTPVTIRPAASLMLT